MKAVDEYANDQLALIVGEYDGDPENQHAAEDELLAAIAHEVRQGRGSEYATVHAAGVAAEIAEMDFPRWCA